MGESLIQETGIGESVPDALDEVPNQRLGRFGDVRHRPGSGPFELGVDVVDGVTNGTKLFEVLIIDAEPDGALT